MPTPVDADTVKRAAKAIFDKRVDAVVTIAQTHQTMLDKQAEAADAERAHSAAWTAGLREGWTEDELKAMNLVPPGRKTPGRPRRRRAAGVSGDRGTAPAVGQEDASANGGAAESSRAEARFDAVVGAGRGPRHADDTEHAG